MTFQQSKKQKVLGMGSCRNGACAWLWCGCSRFVPSRRLLVALRWPKRRSTNATPFVDAEYKAAPK